MMRTSLSTLFLSALVLLVVVPSHAFALTYTYPEPPTANGAISTGGSKCSGSIITGFGAVTIGLANQTYAWSAMPFPSSLPADYNTPGKYCIWADVQGSGTNRTVGFWISNTSATSSFLGDSTLVYTAPSLAASINASPNPVTQGNAASLTWSSVSATSCTGTNFSTGGATSGTVSVSPSVSTTYTVSCTNGSATQTSSVTLGVVPPVTGSCSVSPTSIQAGDSATWTASSSGGTGAYTYSWSGTDQLSGTGSSVTKSYVSAGTKTASVVVTSGSQSVTINCNNSLTVSATGGPLAASCSVSPSPSAADYTTVTWTAAPTGGTGSYTYTWTGTSGLTGSAQIVNKAYGYNNGALETGSVTVTSGTESVTSACTNTVSICYGDGEYSSYSTSAGSGSTMRIADARCCSGYAFTGGSYGASHVCVGGSSGSGAADLSATAVTPTTAQAGVAMTLYSAITNNGGLTASSFYNLFQSATDASGTGATDLGTFFVTSLASGANTTALLNYTFVSTGTTYVRVCADKSSAASTGNVSESNEGNNCGPWTAVTVSAPAPECSDGVDNDGDGLVDYPNDPGCTDANDTTESPNPPAAPTVSLTATPATVNPGSSGTLSWSSSNATTCTGSGFNTGGATSGSVSTGALAAPGPYNYLVTCTGPGGSNNDAKTISIVSAQAYITASNTRINVGDSTDISWSASSVSGTCTVTGTDGYSSGTLSGPTIATTTVTESPTHQTIYTITCGSTSSRVIVNVNGKVQEF